MSAKRRSALPDAPPPATGPVSILVPILVAVALTLAVLLPVNWVSLPVSLLCVCGAIGKTPAENLRRRLSVPLVGLVVFALLCGLASVYAPHGETAVKELPKLLVSLPLAFLVLARGKGKHLRPLLWVFSGVCSVTALICLDAAASEVIHGAYAASLPSFGAKNYSDVIPGWNGSRLNGILNDANVTATLLALAILVLLHLVLTEDKRPRRAAASAMLALCALVFLLSMSRGGILCFAAALVVYLIALRAGDRLRLFFLLLFTGGLTLAAAGLMQPFLGVGSALPLAMALALCVLLALAVERLCLPLTARLAGQGRRVVIVCGVLVALVAVYAVAAFTVPGPYAMDQGDELYRSVQLPAGDYTLDAQWEGETPTVRLYTRTRIQTLNDEDTVLYDGPADAAACTLDEGQTLYLRFYAANGPVTLTSAAFGDAGKIGLDLPLLPDFVVTRVSRDLFSGSSTWMRLQYFKDGLAVFAASPLIGRGLGAFEFYHHAVQPYDYHTDFVHNHLIQIMDETGLLGLAAFLALMLGAAWLLLRRLRRERDGLSAVLLACLVMMNLHGLIEISFSVRAAQTACYFLCALAIIHAAPGEQPVSEGVPPEKPSPRQTRRRLWAGRGVLAAVLAFPLVFYSLYIMHLSAVATVQSADRHDLVDYLTACQQAASQDFLDREPFQLSYVSNMVRYGQDLPQETMEKYVRQLSRHATTRSGYRLAQVYYLPRLEWEAMFVSLQQSVADCPANKDAWEQAFTLLREEALPALRESDCEVYLQGVMDLADQMDAVNAWREQEIALSAENQSFLTLLRNMQGQTEGSAAIFEALQTLPQQITAAE